MARKMLKSGALSTLFGSLATMVSAGIQVEEALLMLAENREKSHFQDTCYELYRLVTSGLSLGEAARTSGFIPDYAVDMLRTGERAGHIEQVLRNLELYYEEEDRLFLKLRKSVGYPAALLCIMALILALTVVVIVPIFTSVYDNMTGSLTSGSYASVGMSALIGWIALIVVVVLALTSLFIVGASNTGWGRNLIMHLLDHTPGVKHAMYQLSLSRFCSSLATLVSSGINDEEAMERALRTVDHPRLRKKLAPTVASMNDVNNPRSLTQAISDSDAFEPLYVRMLNIGMRAGHADTTLSQLSTVFFDDSVLQIESALDSLEPLLAAFLTLAVGATLLAVMLPLIGIMTSIG